MALHLTPFQIVETVAPTVEPITTAQAKTHLRVDGSTEDTYIDTLIEAARQHVESVTGRALVERTYRFDSRVWASEVVLLRPPLISVTSIKYYDTANAQQTWAASNYEVDAAGTRVLLSTTGTFPSVYDRYDSWQLTSKHGYQATSSPLDYRAPIPEALKSAMKLIIGDLFENREATAPMKIHQNRAVDMLLAPYRTRI